MGARPRRPPAGTDLDWDWMTRNLPSGVEPGHDGMVLEMPT